MTQLTPTVFTGPLRTDISLHPGPNSQATISVLLILFSVFSLHRKYGTIDTFKIIKSERKRLVKELNLKMWRSYSPNQRTEWAADPFKRLSYWGLIGYLSTPGSGCGSAKKPQSLPSRNLQVYFRVFHCWNPCQFEPNSSLLWTDVLCIAGC